MNYFFICTASYCWSFAFKQIRHLGIAWIRFKFFFIGSSRKYETHIIQIISQAIKQMKKIEFSEVIHVQIVRKSPKLIKKYKTNQTSTKHYM